MESEAEQPAFDVSALVCAYADYATWSEQLYNFLEPVAHGLGFTGVVHVDLGVEGNEVVFTAEWIGSYGAQDFHTFTFPLPLLNEGHDAITNYCKAEWEKGKQEVAARQLAEQEKQDRLRYEQLKAKYEGEKH